MNPNQLTAQELLRLSWRAAANGAERPALRRLLSELDSLPTVEERLCFEFIAVARERLDRSEDPADAIGWVNVLSKSVSRPRLPGLLESLEGLLLVCFENAGRLPEDREGSRSYSLALVTGLGCIRRLSSERFKQLFRCLNERAILSASGPQQAILQRIMKGS
jgi:hypothetical protein